MRLEEAMGMKVFVSSPATEVRRVALEAIESVGWVALPGSAADTASGGSQAARLAELQDADLVVLILGERYDAEQPSGLSAPHEAWREARYSKMVVVLVQEVEAREPRQAALLDEVVSWGPTTIRAGFRRSADLSLALERIIRNGEQGGAVEFARAAAMTARALSIIRTSGRLDSYQPSLSLAVVGGPRPEVVQSAEPETNSLAKAMHMAALFGPTRILDPEKGTTVRFDSGGVLLTQDFGGTSLSLMASGDLLLASSMMDAMDAIEGRINSLLSYSEWLFDRIDPDRRSAPILVAAALGRTRLASVGSLGSILCSPSLGAPEAVIVDQPVVQKIFSRTDLNHIDRPTRSLCHLVRQYWGSPSAICSELLSAAHV